MHEVALTERKFTYFVHVMFILPTLAEEVMFLVPCVRLSICLGLSDLHCAHFNGTGLCYQEAQVFSCAKGLQNIQRMCANAWVFSLCIEEYMY